ncbi:MAG: LacI family DNA-binding transcriptional regulator [Eubacteriales bacterium]|jgi:LacI family sucrose operon transcriptional repressor|nr:LacI family DNA-binding transcriptional regulator [Eubacteriales bacterium]
MATLIDVAERAGVSVTTVSRMLNNRVPISPATRESIIKAMEDLDYQPNELARSLFKKNSLMIGLIIASANNYFFCKIIDSVEHYVTKHGYKLLLCLSNNKKQNEIAYFNMLKANQVAGVILASNTQNLERYLSFNAPLVTFDRMLSPHIPSVSSDNYNGGVLAAKHLLEKGCKRPAYVMDTRRMGMHANYRYDGFADTFKKSGIDLVVHAAPLDSFITMSYEDTIREFFQTHPEIDCVFTSNDIIAAQILRYCARQGISVPGQLKVIGYDDIDMASFTSPSLTTIRQPVDDLCRYAVESLINFKERNIASMTLFPVSLIEREST